MTTVISFVIDAQPRFPLQGWNLMLALAHHGDIAAGIEVIVHHAPGIAPESLRVFESLGARLVPIAPYGTGAARYCNRLRQLETPEILSADRLILVDADVLPLASLRAIDPGPGVAAKVVDRPYPPATTILRLMAAAGLDPAGAFTARTTFDPASLTLRGNCNGGLYVLTGKTAAKLGGAWRRWSDFCLGQAGILGDWLIHADQLGFAFALPEAGVALSPLPARWNFPTHLARADYADLVPRTLGAIHYHTHMDDRGLPAGTGIGWIDGQIEAMNAVLVAMRLAGPANGLLSDFRRTRASGAGRD